MRGYVLEKENKERKPVFHPIKNVVRKRTAKGKEIRVEY